MTSAPSPTPAQTRAPLCANGSKLSRRQGRRLAFLVDLLVVLAAGVVLASTAGHASSPEAAVATVAILGSLYFAVQSALGISRGS